MHAVASPNILNESYADASTAHTWPLIRLRWFILQATSSVLVQLQHITTECDNFSGQVFLKLSDVFFLWC